MSTSKALVIRNPIETYFNVFSSYHYYFYFFCFVTKILVFCHILNLIFLSPPVNYYCNDLARKPTNSSDSKEMCPCDEPQWNRSIFQDTIQMQYGLHCDRMWMISFSQSMSYLGLLIGALMFGFLSDRFGRLNMFIASSLIMGTAGCLVSAMPTVSTFIFMRCIEGIGTGGATITSYVLCIEYCGLKHRENITVLYHLPINLGHMGLAVVSYVLRDWHHYQLALSIPVLFYVFLKCLLLESPKWLLNRQRVDDATLVMKKICRFNRKPCDNIKEDLETYYASYTKSTSISFWHIFKYKQLTINFCCMSVIYFVCGMGYYGVSQYIGQMSGDIHINVALAGALLLPGTFASIVLLKILSRRSFLMMTSYFSGVLMFVVLFIPNSMGIVRVVFACICNCFFFMSFLIVFLYGVELFPTMIRNSVLGIFSVVSRIGQIIAPQINSLSPTVAGIVFGIMAVIGGLLCLPLPETKEIELPSSFEDSKSPRDKRDNLEMKEAK